MLRIYCNAQQDGYKMRPCVCNLPWHCEKLPASKEPTLQTHGTGIGKRAPPLQHMKSISCVVSCSWEHTTHAAAQPHCQVCFILKLQLSLLLLKATSQTQVRFCTQLGSVSSVTKHSAWLTVLQRTTDQNRSSNCRMCIATSPAVQLQTYRTCDSLWYTVRVTLYLGKCIGKESQKI